MPLKNRSLSQAFGQGIKESEALQSTIQGSENANVERQWQGDIRSIGQEDPSMSGQAASIEKIIKAGVMRGVDPRKLDPYRKMQRMTQQAQRVMKEKGVTTALQSFLAGNSQPLEQVMASMGTQVQPGSLRGNISEGITWVDARDGKTRRMGPKTLQAFSQSAGVKFKLDEKQAKTGVSDALEYRKEKDEKRYRLDRYKAEVGTDAMTGKRSETFRQWEDANYPKSATVTPEDPEGAMSNAEDAASSASQAANEDEVVDGLRKSGLSDNDIAEGLSQKTGEDQGEIMKRLSPKSVAKKAPAEKPVPKEMGSVKSKFENKISKLDKGVMENEEKLADAEKKFIEFIDAWNSYRDDAVKNMSSDERGVARGKDSEIANRQRAFLKAREKMENEIKRLKAVVSGKKGLSDSLKKEYEKRISDFSIDKILRENK